MGSRAKLALLWLVAIAITAPSAFAGERKPVRSLLEIRQDGVIVQKWETSCAAAALATVLTYSQNDPVSEKLVAQGMLRSTDPIKVKVRGGFSLLDMKRFVETRGFKGAAYKGLSMEDLLTLQSPIVPIDFHGNPHFVVVRGLNTAGEVHLADPAFGNHAMSVGEFQSIWREGIGMNRLTLRLAIACAAALVATTVNAETVDDLKRELAAKKAYIAKLERRLRDLEQRPSAPKPTLVTAPVAPPPPRVAVAPAPPPSPEDDEMERALERTLVREGALVLPPWTFELTPQFSYAHWDSVQDPFIRNSYSAGLSFRMGLPWTSQVTVSVPYVWDEGRDPFPSSSGLSDVGVLLSKELLIDDGGWVPNLVGSVGWTSPTSRGSAFSPIPYVSGFQGGLTASKRLDPVVVFLGASYFSSASRDIALTQDNPSDVAALRVGGSLAISPSTSVTTGFNVAYLTNPHFTDLVVPNSDRVLSTVDVGFSTIVWTRTLLNVTAQFGITGHVPDFRVITSLPIRF